MHVIIDGILLCFIIILGKLLHACMVRLFMSVCKWLRTNIHSIYMCCLCPLYRFMKTPDRLSALRNARDTIRKRDRKIAKIKVRLESLTSKRGIAVESDVRRKLLK